jgi:hypothetical protein
MHAVLRSLAAVAVVMGLAFSSFAQENAEDIKAADKALEAKGVKRVGSQLSLPEEGELGKMLRAVTKLKKAVADAERPVAALEKKAADNKKLITAYTQKRREINAALAKGGLGLDQTNKLIAAYNELGDRISLLIENGGMEKELKVARGEHYKARAKRTSNMCSRCRSWPRRSSRSTTT